MSEKSLKVSAVTYIRLARGFAYLVAVIDWYSRKVLAWRLSNTLDAGFCVDCLEQSLNGYGTPEIFNTDQGCQFTSEFFTGVLQSHNIAISMDGRGRALDNIFVERLWRNVKHDLHKPRGGVQPVQELHVLIRNGAAMDCFGANFPSLAVF